MWSMPGHRNTILNFIVHTKKEPRGDQYKFSSAMFIFSKHQY